MYYIISFMVFKDIDQINEIDNELRDFRKEFNNYDVDKNHSLIVKGGRISQHLVEHLYRNNSRIRHNIYERTFEEWLIYECDFIPKYYKDFLIIINNYRSDVVNSTEYKIELDKIILDFLKIFNNFLIWFEDYYYKYFESFNEKKKFKELTKTINFLNKQLNLEKNRANFNISNCDRIDKIQHTLVNIMDKLDNHEKKIDNIDKKLDFLKDLSISIKNNQEKVKESLTCKDDKEIDKIMKKYSDNCVNQIIENTKNNYGIWEYEQEKRKLINSLGKSAWNKLNEKSQTFLITSKITYNHLIMMDDIIDYSGVCLLVTKALEIELVNRFFKKFTKYLKNHYGKDYSQYPTPMLNYDSKNNTKYLKKNKQCTLGTITYILCPNNDEKINEKIRRNNLLKLIEYSKTELLPNLNDEEIKILLEEYGKEIDNIRKKYRNPAAHTNELKRIDAEECFNLVLDIEKFLKKMLDSFKI